MMRMKEEEKKIQEAKDELVEGIRKLKTAFDKQFEELLTKFDKNYRENLTDEEKSKLIKEYETTFLK